MRVISSHQSGAISSEHRLTDFLLFVDIFSTNFMKIFFLILSNLETGDFGSYPKKYVNSWEKDLQVSHTSLRLID
jgi:hypothetical protein